MIRAPDVPAGAATHRLCWRVALAVWVVTACGSGSPYRVTTDLGPAIRALGSDDLEVREPAVDRIVALGRDALPALEIALHHEPSGVRRGVVQVLESIDEPAAADMLSQVAAMDPDVDVRYEAIGALGGLGLGKSQRIVEAALADPVPKIRLAAVGACAAVCSSREAIDRLVELALTDEPLANGIAARAVLVQMLAEGDAQRAQVVHGAIQSAIPDALARAGTDEGAARAALLASDTGNDAGRAVLARIARRGVTPLLRLQAIAALGQVGSSEDVEMLATLDGESTFGDYAYDALRRLDERGVVSAGAALGKWNGHRPAAALPPPPGSR